MTTTAKGIPISKATIAEAAIAHDWAQEHRSQAWADYEAQLAAGGGKVKMAYLRRVPKAFAAGLAELLPTATVEWSFEIDYHGRRVQQTARHTCFPVVLLAPVFEYMRPSGTQHVAEIDEPLTPGEHRKLEPKEEAGPTEAPPPPTRVIFRVNKAGGDVYALMPDDQATAEGYVTCYQIVGGHCSANYPRCIATSRPAKADEYAEVRAALERQGYNLRVVSRR